MKKVNVVFGENYDDVDILLVPNEIAENLDHIVQNFFDWLRIPTNQQHFLVKTQEGKIVLGIGTEELLWWINRQIPRCKEKATIVSQHTRLQSEFQIVDL